jgi:hypothetical protein
MSGKRRLLKDCVRKQSITENLMDRRVSQEHHEVLEEAIASISNGSPENEPMVINNIVLHNKANNINIHCHTHIDMSMLFKKC